MEVGEVIQFYDNDHRFPAWGFGARTSDGNVSHCFNLSTTPTQPEVLTIQYLWFYFQYCNLFNSLSFMFPIHLN